MAFLRLTQKANKTFYFKTNTHTHIKTMKKTIDQRAFIQAFTDYNRESQFSVKARKELFQYMEECEAGSGTEYELDVIALCCEFTEYDSIKECIEAFKHLDDFEFCESDDDYRDVFSHYTQVIVWEDDCVLIQQF